MIKAFAVLGLLLLIQGCATSSQEMMAKERFDAYRSALKEYQATESRYLDHLTNMQEYPTDAWLLEQRKIQEKELEQERLLVQVAREELDRSIAEWKDYIGDMRSAQRAAGFENAAQVGEAMKHPGTVRTFSSSSAIRLYPSSSTGSSSSSSISSSSSAILESSPAAQNP